MAVADRSVGNLPAWLSLVLALLPPAALAAVVFADLRAVPAVPFLAAGLALEIGGVTLGVWAVSRSARRGARRLWAGISGLLFGAIGATFFGLGLWVTVTGR